MKHSDQHITSHHGSILAGILLWSVPLLLIVPNIILDFTEIHYTACERAINVLLPAGIYLLLMSAWRRNGITTFCLLPVMVLCAFQIVLLFLYGESIIAVDMFLNVTTTNVHEAGELLLNLGPAIAVVCVLYMPPLVMAGIALGRCAYLSRKQQRPALYSGAILSIAGIICMAIAFCSTSGYNPARRLFPVNVTANIFTAVERTEASNHYFETSEAFSYHAAVTDPDSVPEIFVLVIGETSRAGNWQLNGYERPTNPRLSKRDGVISYTKALSESNTTHKSVPLLMSHLGAAEFADSIYSSRSVIDAFREAGYRTVWLSNQQRNGSLIDFSGSRAEGNLFLTDDGKEHRDLELCPYLSAAINTEPRRPVFVVLHTYGSHFNYQARYPEEYGVFGPEIATEAEPSNRAGLINAYDNAIVYTDAVLDSIISTVSATGRPAAMVYLADHGEDIYDDDRERFLHASPTPTYWQIHVPMLVWLSDTYRTMHPEKYAAACANSSKDVSSSQSAFHTLMSLSGISTPYYKPELALTENCYNAPARQYLNDYNEDVDLEEAGLRESDFRQLALHSISAR